MAPRKKTGDPEPGADATALALAWIVHRLMIDPRGITAQEIETTFGVTKRTRNKWIKRLREDFTPFAPGTGGMRIATFGRGAKATIRLVPDGEDTSDVNDLVEVAAAVHVARRLLAVTSGTSLDRALSMLIRDAEDRVRQTSQLNHLLSHLDRKFYAAPQAEKDYGPHADAIVSISKALTYHKQIAFKYKSPRAAEARLVRLEPYTLLFGDGAIYVGGRSLDTGDIIKFDVVRIEGDVKLGSKFRYPDASQYSPSTLVEGSFGVFTEDGPAQDVRVVFEPIPWLVNHLTERNWHPSQRVDVLDDDSVELRFRVRSLVGLGAMLFGLARYIREVDPAPEQFRARSELAPVAESGDNDDDNA